MTDGVVKLDLYLGHRKALIDHAAPILGCRHRAEDVVQDAWFRFAAAETALSLPEAAPAAGGRRAALTGYLFRIVRNLALDGYRRLCLERRLFAPESQIELAQAMAPSPEAELMARQELRRVARALDRMPARMRVALRMHRLDGARLREIAAHLGISITRAHELVAEGIERCARARSGQAG